MRQSDVPSGSLSGHARITGSRTPSVIMRPGRFWNLLVLDADTGRNMDSSCRSGPPSLSPRQLLVP